MMRYHVTMIVTDHQNDANGNRRQVIDLFCNVTGAHAVVEVPGGYGNLLAHWANTRGQEWVNGVNVVHFQSHRVRPNRAANICWPEAVDGLLWPKETEE